MYWYFKYPFLAISLLLLFGIGVFLYKNLPDAPKKPNSKVEVDDTTKTTPIEQDNISIDPIVVDNNNKIEPPSKGEIKSVQPIESSISTTKFDRFFNSAIQQYKSGNLLGARRILYKLITLENVVKFDRSWLKVVKQLDDINTELLISDLACPEKVTYKVKSGDALVKIAYRHKTTVTMIKKSNNMMATEDNIRVGQNLNVPQGPWHIEVHPAQFMLILFHKQKLYKIYNICIGKKGQTPSGTFKIRDKIFHPDYYSPNGLIHYGNAGNVLGTHWLDLQPIGDTPKTIDDIGIHGTWEPKTIGTASSKGCVRMLNKDIEELFNIIPNGTEVTIKKQFN